MERVDVLVAMGSPRVGQFGFEIIVELVAIFFPLGMKASERRGIALMTFRLR